MLNELDEDHGSSIKPVAAPWLISMREMAHCCCVLDTHNNVYDRMLDCYGLKAWAKTRYSSDCSVPG